MIPVCLACLAAATALVARPGLPPHPLPPAFACTAATFPSPAASENIANPRTARAEWFDVAAGRVLRTYPVTDELRRETERLLLAVDGVHPRARIEPDGGHILHVELSPPLRLSTRWVNGDVADVYIMFDAAEPGEPVKLLLTRGSSVQWLTSSRSAAGLLAVLRTLDPLSTPPAAEE